MLKNRPRGWRVLSKKTKHQKIRTSENEHGVDQLRIGVFGSTVEDTQRERPREGERERESEGRGRKIDR